jgi:hypothetical protein
MLLFLCSVLTAGSPAVAYGQEARVNEDAALVQIFEERVAAYVKAAKSAQEGLPPLRAREKKQDLVQHQEQLAGRIRAAREGAKQGDICSPEIAGELRRLIGLALQGGNASRVRQSLRSAEPVRLALKVNAPFPLPLQSTPPTLLLNLPRLPEELEYRVVGTTLVLRDTTANTIVDFVPDALPSRK